MNKLDRPLETANVTAEPAATGSAATPQGSARQTWKRWLRHLSFTNISVIYVLIALIVVFSFWAPDTFPTWTTARSVLNGSAVPGLMALALVIPLSARIFDLSIGNAMGLANMLVAWLLVNQKWGVLPAVLVALAAGIAMGVFNALVVVGARIDSFIGTLATGSLFATVGSILSTQSIYGSELNGSFSKLATAGWGGITVPFFLTVAVGALFWFFQNYTVTGRRIYALGFNARGSELVGIRSKRLKFACLMLAGLAAGIAGILLASTITSGSPDVGPPYLLSAYAAAFLGATQFGGRFNAWGTLLAVVLLNTGTSGIYLVGGHAWAQSMFSGVVLLLALGASNLEQSVRARSWIRASARQRRNDATGAALSSPSSRVATAKPSDG